MYFRLLRGIVLSNLRLFLDHHALSQGEVHRWTHLS